MNEAKIFLDKKQEEHFNKFGVYADVNSKIAEWMQEYTDEVVKKLTIPVVVSSKRDETLELLEEIMTKVKDADSEVENGIYDPMLECAKHILNNYKIERR